MPQYILPESDALDFLQLDAFLRGYIQAAFFTNQSCIPMTEFHTTESQNLIKEGQADGELPEDAGFIDIHPATLKGFSDDCLAFIDSLPRDTFGRNDLDLAYDYAPDSYDDEQAGADFWYTRNGHGVGFWDRGLGEIGDRLTEAAKVFSPEYLWFTEPDDKSPTGYGWVRSY